LPQVADGPGPSAPPLSVPCRDIKHAPIAQCTSDALANVRKGTGAIERPLWATSLYDQSWP